MAEQISNERSFNHGWPLPPAHFLNKLRVLSEGLYPQEQIEGMRNGGYKPFILGFEHGPEGYSVPAIKDVFSWFKSHGSGGSPRVAMEIIPPSALRNVQALHNVKQEFKSKEGGIEQTQREVISAEIKDLEEKMGFDKEPSADRLAFWLFENDFDVIPVEHEDVILWVSEQGLPLRIPNPTREQVVRELAIGIRREVHGFDILDRERPDMIAVGYTHAYKYNLFLDPESKRNFYFFNFDHSDPNKWEDFLQLFREAYTLYRSEMKNDTAN